MIEYKPNSETASDAIVDGALTENNDGKVSLSKLWEIIVRTKRLPDELETKSLFNGFRERLCDPEKEVRQHAFRVLSDLIPLIELQDVDNFMQIVQNEIVTNLGNSSPSVRKGAIDCLKVYLKHSEKPNEVLRELISTGVENCTKNNVPTNTVLGIIMALPHLSTIDQISENVLIYTIDQLCIKSSQIIYQETALKSLFRLRKKLGIERFNNLLDEDALVEFTNLCDVYNLHELPPNSKGDMNRDDISWTDSRSGSEDIVEDKVILETEIKLNSGSAITMQIHEESRCNSTNDVTDSDEDMRKGSAVVRILTDDSEQEYYESSRRTPRRVRFGGEVVKMRTPESDSNHPSDDNDTIIIEEGSSIHITVRDGISTIKTKTTRKSMIPIRIQTHSAPGTPKKKYLVSQRRLHKSAPDLSNKKSTPVFSKIPLPSSNSNEKQQNNKTLNSERRNSKIIENNAKNYEKVVKEKENFNIKIQTEENSKVETTEVNRTEQTSNDAQIKESSKLHFDLLEIDTNIPVRSRRNSRADDVYSPKPVHNEIELFHNLTRSPERKTKLTTINKENNQSDTKNNGPKIENNTQQKENVNNNNNINNNNGKNDTTENNNAPSISNKRRNSALEYKKNVDQQNQQISSAEIINRNNWNRNVEIENKIENSFVQITDKNIVEVKNKDSSRRNSIQNNWNRNIVMENNVENQKPPTTIDSQETTNKVYNSFHVYPNTLSKDHETADQIPTKNTGDCLTCSSSGSEPINTAKIQVPVLDPAILNDLCRKDDISARGRALENLIMSLKWPETCPSLESSPALLLLHLLFSCEQQIRLQSQAQEALQILFQNFTPEVLENCLKQIVIGLSKMGAPDGVRLAVQVMQRISPSKFLTYLVIDSNHRSNSSNIKIREGTLQLFMSACRLFPSFDIDVDRGTHLATRALKDRKRRVKQAALETLACLAQIGGANNVLTIVNNSVQDWSDKEEVLHVVRARLSRKQLPIVDPNGSVRYTAPREQTEIDWLSSGSTNTSPQDSALKSNLQSVVISNNYWKQHSRQNADALHHNKDLSLNSDSEWSDVKKDESLNNNNAQIWAIDPSDFSGQNKYSSHNNGAVRPIYILQPDQRILPNKSTSLESHRNENSMLYRKYDRGRSFSPPKDINRNYSNTSNGRLDRLSDNQEYGSIGRRNKKFNRYHDSFRKSFSSEQLYSNHNKVHEGHSFSMSSGSSSTSTASSRKGVWIRDFRSSIPIPIQSDQKLRLRLNRNQTTHVAPLIAQEPIHNREKPSPRTTPILCRVSPIKHPTSSPGSESSGYVTPPADHQQHLNEQTFIRLDSSEERCESDNALPPPDFHTVKDFIPVESQSRISQIELVKNESISSVESLVDPETNLIESETRLKRESTATSLNELDFREPPRSAFIEQRNKSKSEVDLNNTLPDIMQRKNINSAPALNKIITNYDEMPITPAKAVLPGSVVPQEDNDSSEEEEIQIIKKQQEIISPVRRLSRRPTSKPVLAKKSCKLSRAEVSLYPNTLRPFSKPKEGLHEVLSKLDSSEWEITMDGLQGLVRIIRHHPAILESHMHNVCVALGKHIRNLRSQVARAACVAANEMFTVCKRGLDVELEELVTPLLQRTADTNKFLRRDANESLDVMSENSPPSRVIHLITCKGCTHQNGVVRAAAVRILYDLTKRIGPDKVFQFPKDIRDRVLISGANALTEGSLECRRNAKGLLGYLSSHQLFNKSLLDAVPQQTLRHIGKTLNSLK